ncbi:MAG TPA: hypothetical protein VKC17_00540 [Sphingomicrobium sp.]|nr:hypothetical protein [Sphingomicrobium sp.]
MLIKKVGWGLLAATVVWLFSRSGYLALLAFSFVAGAALFRAYWHSVSEKTDA